MESTRYDLNEFEKPDYDENDFISKAIQALIERCQTYIDDNDSKGKVGKVRHFLFGNPQAVQAKHIKHQLGLLNNHNRFILPDELSFKQVVLKSYIIALQEYLPTQSDPSNPNRLLVSLKEFVNQFFPNQNFDDVAQKYRKQIDDVKGYLSSVVIRKGQYLYTVVGGITLFTSAFEKHNPKVQYNPNVQHYSSDEIEINLMQYNKGRT